MLICLAKLIFDMGGEFKIMYFTSSNLLHYFLNEKYFFFFSLREVMWKNMGQPNKTHNQIDPT